MSRLSPRLIAAIAAIALLAVLGGGIATAAALRASAVERYVLARFVNPRGADGRTMYLQKVVVPAGTPLAAHYHDGSQIAAITSGTLRYTVLSGGKVRVLSPDAVGQKPAVVHEIAPGETYDVKAGQSVVEPAGMKHEVEALPGDDVVIYVSSLLVNGAPLSVKLVP